MTKIIKGNFDLELAKHYTNLIYQFEDDLTKKELSDIYLNYLESTDLKRIFANMGAEGKVFISGIHAIKYPYISYEDMNIKREKLIHEFDIGTELEQIGLNVPKMHAVCEYEDLLFLIMQRLNLTPFEQLTRKQKTEAKKQFTKQFILARDSFYLPGDTNLETNYGFDIKENKGFFYDFTDWRQI